MKKILKDLDDALKFLIITNMNNLNYIKSVNEESFTTEQHHSVGMNLRNDWGLWTNESELSIWFHNKGIYHADDMSSIILTSFHRTVNNKDIDLDNQIKYYIDYWEKNDPKVNTGFYNLNKDE